MTRYFIAAWLAACLAMAGASAPADERRQVELLTDWNSRVLEMAEAEDGLLTLKGVRTAAMMHIAIHDALAAIQPRYTPYAYDDAMPEADPIAASVIAAWTVAADQFPDQRPALTALREAWMSDGGGDAAAAHGAEVGTAAARAILGARTDDGWDNEAKYRWHPMAPGVYAEFAEHSGTPEGFVFGAGWATARPFALESQDQFRSPPPPDIDSSEYTEAYQEVKEVGRYQSETRTADQTHLALWWKDFAESSHNRLARDLVQREQIDLVDAARLFAMLNIAIFDAYVNVFDNKFYYNHWRPYTAIRWAENDGNPHTIADRSWDNTHRHTYAFPSYPSAHGSACAAAMSAIEDTFGDDYAFTMRIPEVDIAGPFSGKMKTEPPTRGFGSPSEAAVECAMSRVYLGIHFRYDSIEGYRLGRRIGEYVVANYLQPLALTGHDP
jgi:hypothetical protein